VNEGSIGPHRFERDESNDYWRRIHAARGEADLLDAVCLPGAPPWLNRYIARVQLRAFEEAMSHSGVIAGARVIEVGCGNGRWSSILQRCGADVTANDLSPEAIARNQKRIPGVDFRVGDFLELDLDARSFDLGVSVTVVQHFPPAAQDRAIARLAELIRPGGHLLMLENIQDQGPHVFARSISGWLTLFRAHGFDPVHVRGYEYDLALRAARRLMNVVASLRPTQPEGLPNAPGAQDTSGTPATPSRGSRLAKTVIQVPAVMASYPLERLSGPVLPDRWATHASFVLRKSTATE